MGENGAATARPAAATRGTADQSSVRSANLALVLREVYRTPGLSRADVAVRTGLTRATVSRLVKDAIETGLISESEPTDQGKQGRPSTPLHPAPGTSVGIGLEVNVDHVAGIAIDLSGQVLDQFHVTGDFADSDATAVMSLVADGSAAMLERLRALGVPEVGGVSIAVPGVVNTDSGQVVYAPNLGWAAVSPADLVRGSFPDGAHIWIHNDADLQSVAAAGAMAQQGEEPRAFLYVSGDTGIGGAIVSEGQIVAGERGWAGEIGHTTVDPDGPLCHCGAQGCLETFAGWRSVAEAAGVDWELGVGALVQRLESGDQKAKAAVDRAAWALGIAIANAVKLLDVRTVVLGTGLGPIFPWLQPGIAHELDRRLLAADSGDVSVVAPPTVDFPAALGGALKAVQQRLAEPEVPGALL